MPISLAGMRAVADFTAHLSPTSKIKLGNDFSKCLLATGGLDKEIKVFSLNDSKELLANKLHSTASSFAFDRDDDYLVNGSENGSIKVWDLKTCQPIRTLSGHRAQVTCLEYYQYHNTNYLGSGSSDTSIRLWDIRKRGTIFQYTKDGHKEPVTVLKFSPDGKFLVSGSEDNTVKIWDLRNGHCISTKTESTLPINDIKFHPNEMLFASAGQDKCVNFYDFEKLELVSSSDKTSHPITSIQFDISGSSLYCLSGETVRNMTWEPSSLIQTWTTPFGKHGEMMLSHNRVVTVGVKNKKTILAFEVDITQKAQEPMRPPKYASTPINKNNGNNRHNELNTDESEDPFQSRQVIPRSPPPPTAPHPGEEKPNISHIVPKHVSKAGGKKKVIRPTNPNKQKDIPVEIHVTPKIINQPVSKSKDRPKAIVRPNNSTNFEKRLEPVDELEFGKLNASTKRINEMVSVSPTFLATMQSRNIKLYKAKYLWSKGRIADVLRSTCMDRSVLYDLLGILLEQPDIWSLDIAVDAVQGCTELSRSKHSNHIKMASAVSKFVLTQYSQLIGDSLKSKTTLPTLNNEQRVSKCTLISKLVGEVRVNLEENEQRQSDNQFVNTLRELDIMITAIKL